MCASKMHAWPVLIGRILKVNYSGGQTFFSAFCDIFLSPHLSIEENFGKKNKLKKSHFVVADRQFTIPV